MKKLILIILSYFTLLACQTSPLKQFQSIQPGMDKDNVLETMGSPYSNVRSKGLDKWTYVFYDNQLRYEKEIHFKSGHVTYVGDPKQPEVTADAVEIKKSEEDKKDELESAKRKEENKRAYAEYEEQNSGSSNQYSESAPSSSANNNKNKKVKYAPKYEPIQ